MLNPSKKKKGGKKKEATLTASKLLSKLTTVLDVVKLAGQFEASWQYQSTIHNCAKRLDEIAITAAESKAAILQSLSASFEAVDNLHKATTPQTSEYLDKAEDAVIEAVEAAMENVEADQLAADNADIAETEGCWADLSGSKASIAARAKAAERAA